MHDQTQNDSAFPLYVLKTGQLEHKGLTIDKMAILRGWGE